MAFREEGNCFAQELIFHRCVLTACSHQNQFPPIKIVLWASAHFVHQFPLLPWGACLKILDYTARDQGSLVRKHWRKLKEVKGRSSPLPQISHTWAMRTWQLVIQGPLWMEFPPPSVAPIGYSLMLAWQPWGWPVSGYTPQKGRSAAASPPLDSGSPAPDVEGTKAKLQEPGNPAELPSVGKDTPSTLGFLSKTQGVENPGSPHLTPILLLAAFRGNKHVWCQHSIPSHAWKYPDSYHDLAASQRGAWNGAGRKRNNKSLHSGQGDN